MPGTGVARVWRRGGCLGGLGLHRGGMVVRVRMSGGLAAMCGRRGEHRARGSTRAARREMANCGRNSRAAQREREGEEHNTGARE